MKIQKSTRLYESWLARHIDLLDDDLALKHRLMAKSPFPFLRATFYRWAQRFAEDCPELMKAPRVLGVGDLHVENFGTWRDADGRLVWGVNDFDEAVVLPWVNDLVRLAVSAHIAIREHGLKLPSGEVCDALLAGYARGLEQGGRPVVLEEEHGWLRDIAHGELRDPVRFWKKLDAVKPLEERKVPRSVLSRMRRALPERDLEIRIGHRVAGLGSLGRPRYVAMAEWHGGRIARETKPLAPSAWYFAEPDAGEAPIRYEKIVEQAVRAPDPWLSLDGDWVVRRLSPHCSRIELGDLPARHDEARLLRAMGAETANIHLGTPGARKAIRADLAARKTGWLDEAAARMRAAVEEDWKAFVARTAEEEPVEPVEPVEKTPRAAT